MGPAAPQCLRVFMGDSAPTTRKWSRPHVDCAEARPSSNRRIGRTANLPRSKPREDRSERIGAQTEAEDARLPQLRMNQMDDSRMKLGKVAPMGAWMIVMHGVEAVVKREPVSKP